MKVSVKHLVVLVASLALVSVAFESMGAEGAPGKKKAGGGKAGSGAKAKARPSGPPPDPSVPAPKGGGKDERFMKMHDEFVARAKQGNIGLLFIGDSITEGWRGAQEVWKKNYEPYNPANFGIGGDQTQHVLWRILNGELEGISPKVAVLMIGTNNTGANTAKSIAQADAKIVETIRTKLPNTRVLLLAIFPRSDAVLQKKIDEINKELAQLDDGKTVRYFDIGKKFLDADGNIPKDIMPDGLHPNAKGYEIWAEAMNPLLQEMMK